MKLYLSPSPLSPLTSSPVALSVSVARARSLPISSSLYLSILPACFSFLALVALFPSLAAPALAALHPRLALPLYLLHPFTLRHRCASAQVHVARCILEGNRVALRG